MKRRTIELADIAESLAETPAWLVSLFAFERVRRGDGTCEHRVPFGRVLYTTVRVGSTLERVDFWLDGSKRRERVFVDGRLHGRCTAWRKSGRKRWVGEFKAGAQSGEWFYFRRNGKLDGRRTGVYERGLRFAAMKGFNDWNA